VEPCPPSSATKGSYTLLWNGVHIVSQPGAGTFRLGNPQPVSGITERRALLALTFFAIYLAVTVASSLTKRPWEDEPFYANPAFKLVQPPLHFLTTAAWFKLFGFGVLQLRLEAVRQHEGVWLLLTGFISFDYFFLVSASDGRMDMMCASLRLRPSRFTSPFESRTSPASVLESLPGSCLRAHSPHGSHLLVRPGFPDALPGP
jgi:hypothetical protein